MRFVHVLRFLMVLAAACVAEVSEPQAAAPPPQVRGDYELLVPAVPNRAPAELQGPQPMPALEERIERVIAEVGPDALAVMPADGRVSRSRRDLLAALGPAGRASLRRHDVRVEQLARYLSRRSQ